MSVLSIHAELLEHANQDGPCVYAHHSAIAPGLDIVILMHSTEWNWKKSRNFREAFSAACVVGRHGRQRGFGKFGDRGCSCAVRLMRRFLRRLVFGAYFLLPTFFGSHAPTT